MGGHFAQDTELQLERVVVFCCCCTSVSLRIMANWEPSVEELAKLATLKDVAQLVAMPTNVSSSLFTALGATGDEHPSVLGMMEAEEITAEISGLKIEDKDLSIIHKGHIRKLIHLSRLIADTEQGSQRCHEACRRDEDLHGNTQCTAQWTPSTFETCRFAGIGGDCAKEFESKT